MATAKKLKASSGPAKKKAKKKKKTAPDLQVLLQRRQRSSIRALFNRLGFLRVNSDGKHFNFKGRTGEFDDVFMFENIMILAEYTVGASGSSHVGPKSILYNFINNNQSDWVEFAGDTFDLSISKYNSHEYQVCICYFSTNAVSTEIYQALDFVKFLNGTKFRYFDALAKSIHKSARFEFFKYLGLDFKKVGPEIKNTSSSVRTFSGFILPESYSSFPKGFKVVSFYSDPNALLTMSYVLRRDSWRDEHGLYQRVLQKSRMAEMRKYLVNEERVFVNNIIVTLPNDTNLNEPGSTGKNIEPKQLQSVRNIEVAIPFRSDVIGLVDGQHRVFCYHEGSDVYEKQIVNLRDRQNLLVTGIIYPPEFGEGDKRRFEAKLFLEINDKQKRAKSELKQSIELILNPYSAIAISKAVVQRLNQCGALREMLQINYFDPPRLIRTSSIVSYGLRPLLKLEGTDSLYAAWTDASKEKLYELQRGKPDVSKMEPVLSRYVEYCVASLNDLLIASRKVLGSERWALADKPKDRFLTPTVINGLIVCLRHVIENGKPLAQSTYEKKLASMEPSDFSRFKSSNWGALGAFLFKKYFKNP